MANYRTQTTLIFYAGACALAWLVALPLWLMDSGLTSPLATPLLVLMMFTPVTSAVLVSRFAHGIPWKQLPQWLGCTQIKPYGRTLLWLGVALVMGLSIAIINTFLASALGWFKLDLAEFSALREQLTAATGQNASEDIPVKIIVIVQICTLPLAAITNSVIAAGEEIGWRGYLLPALQHLGTWPALALSGLLWGLWHSPIILLGYNFNRTDWTGVAYMTIGCMLLGILIGWVRLFSENIWPAALFHGAFNSSAGFPLLIGALDQDPDPALFIALGVSGWITISLMLIPLIPAILKYHRASPQQRQMDVAAG
ncbi:CPBP family intramembrane glutamic endopeptidase [Corynebacterium sp.]|uniref:CPBP family intramembrane glutamic endopeptidase n=1 Tax=Corynebacterium sp. TaxID=1720 RepID=UPI0026DD37CA|nr:CPBP family intramembrane glutamic endopeptidase [Corynebacterium sp.]MDO5077317.1 CPBP family intramembrane metalloprotease [Corynebacterium sp.]